MISNMVLVGQRKIQLSALLFLAGLFPFRLSAQQEKLVVLRDKEVAYRGDTIWLCAYILSNSRVNSSNLHVETWTDGKKKIQDDVFHCDTGLVMAQVQVPDTPGNYWLRLYTLNSESQDFPFTVRPKSNDYTIKRLPASGIYSQLVGGLINIGHDSGGYYIQKRSPAVQFYSVAISDTSQPYHFADFREVPAPQYATDTESLSLEWLATGKQNLKGRDLLLAYEEEKRQQFLNYTFDSSQRVKLTNLFFYDSSAYLHYQLNRSSESFELIPLFEKRRFELPEICIVDTVREKYVELTGEKGAKVLAAATVHASWKYRNQWLHKKYISGNPWNIKFEMGYTNWNYDLDKDTCSKWVRQTVGGYLWDQQKPHPTVHYVIGFVDGARTPWEYAMNVDIKLVKYIEFVEGVYDGQLECVYCTIWTRKGEDARKLPGDMKAQRLKGYTRAINWTTPDRYTLNWIPFEKANKKYVAEKAPFNLQLVAFLNWRPYYLEVSVE